MNSIALSRGHFRHEVANSVRTQRDGAIVADRCAFAICLVALVVLALAAPARIEAPDTVLAALAMIAALGRRAAV